MMREILFRGKRADNGEWVCGCVVEDWSKKNTKPNMKIHNNIGKFAVIPETIGMYTNLRDKNRKKIFEGDIVKCTDEKYGHSFVAVVLFGNPNCEYNWGFQLKRISGADANTDILLWLETEDGGVYSEVIGNIHDSPELVKGATGDA